MERRYASFFLSTDNHRISMQSVNYLIDSKYMKA